MERVSDKNIELVIMYFKSDRFAPFRRNVIDALTELRERRAAEKAPCPEHAKMVADADWVGMDCPKCHHAMVAIDQFGLRCMMDGCGWKRDAVNSD